MHNFERNLITEWRRLGLPFAEATAVVAVSGGVDSTALLIGLAELKRRKKLDVGLVAAHFNHKLRGRASNVDERFVRELSGELKADIVSERAQSSPRSNIEQLARDARYAFLKRAAEQSRSSIVLTAHTMNDQAETVLMNLIRGSGPDGLAGMPVRRQLDGTRTELVRPLLHWCKRIDTEAYCRAMRVEPRHDAMNDDTRFTRVRIRKQVIPLLAELNPKVVETLARTGDFLIGHADATDSSHLSVTGLRTLDDAQRLTRIRSWLGKERGSLRGITLKHIDAVARLVNSRKSGRIVEIPGGHVVKRSGRLAYKDIKLEN